MGKQRIILGISGASGFQYGYKALQLFKPWKTWKYTSLSPKARK